MIGIGIMFLIPIVVDVIFLENNFLNYLVGALFSISIGMLLKKFFQKNNGRMRLKHGMIVSSIAWLWAGIIGSLVMYLSINLGFIDCFFENMSALTGSGFSIFTNVEILPYSILFLRALEQWIGGLGVVVMVLGVLTRPGTVSSKLYKSEAREERIKPSVSNTLHKTLNIYLVYTIAGIILYICAGMPIFDSICNTFTTISTGGMSIKNANIGFYKNNLIYVITMILMILGATSFLVHYRVVKTKGKAIFQDIQFKVLISVIVIVSLLLYALSNIMPMDIVFHTISAITTTGASISSSMTMSQWPAFVLLIIIVLMLLGGSSGSTVGSIKLIRVIIFIKGVYKKVKETLSPEGRVVTVKVSGHKIPEKAIGEAGSYISLYLIFILISWIVFCYYGYKPFDSLFEIISAQGNVGLSLGIIGHDLEPSLKLLTTFNMWIGRLEIIPVIVLLRSFFEVIRR